MSGNIQPERRGPELVQEAMIGIAEAARLLNCSARTVTRYAERCQIPAIQIGNRWKFLPSVLDAWRRERLMSNCYQEIKRKGA